MSGGARVAGAALAAQNKLPEAQKEMSAAMALIMNASQRNVRYSAWTTSARLRASLGGASNVSQAIGILEKTAREASQAGMPGFELEASWRWDRLSRLKETRHADGPN